MQQQRDAHCLLRAEASTLASQTPTHLNAEFRVVEHDTSAEKDEFCIIQMQEFAIQAGKDSSFFRKLGKKVRRKPHQVPWSITSRAACRVIFLESSTPNSVNEAIESEGHRLQNQESFLSHEARRQDHRHQQKVIQMQKHLDEASKQSQEDIEQRCEEKLTSRAGFRSTWWIGRPPDSMRRFASCKRTSSHCRVFLEETEESAR